MEPKFKVGDIVCSQESWSRTNIPQLRMNHPGIVRAIFIAFEEGEEIIRYFAEPLTPHPYDAVIPNLSEVDINKYSKWRPTQGSSLNLETPYILFDESYGVYQQPEHVNPLDIILSEIKKEVYGR